MSNGGPENKIQNRSLQLLTFVLTLFLIMSVRHSLTQDVDSDPYRYRKFTELDWWFLPYEENAFMRIPYVPGFYRDFSAPTENDIWLVGREYDLVKQKVGVISYSGDGGKTWQKQTNKFEGGEKGVYAFRNYVASGLNGIHFIDTRNGWAVGSNGLILRTRDGGENWEEQESPENAWLMSVYFLNQRRGWAVGSNSTLLYTTNGGENWEKYPLQTGRLTLHFFSIHFQDKQFGRISDSSGQIVKTSDGGKTWNYEPGSKIELPNILSIHFSSFNDGWAFEKTPGQFHTTRDGGVTWDRAPPDARRLFTKRSQVGDLEFGVNFRGELFRIDRDKRSLAPLIKTRWQDLDDVHFSDVSSGIINGNLALTTDDGGATWRVIKYSGQSRFKKIHFANKRDGWGLISPGAAEETLKIGVTTDGGIHWSREDTSFKIISGTDLFMTGPGRGVIVGRKGLIIKKNSSDAPWRLQKKRTSANLNKVTFVDSRRGWVVGDYGTILFSQDGGESWNPQKSPIGENLISVSFIDQEQGWASGESGLIIKTTNGGENWRRLSGKQTKNLLYELKFVDAQNGWGLDEDSRLTRTRNGGATWLRKNFLDEKANPLQAEFNAIFFADKQNGWVVGEGAMIRYTHDGGQTWQTPKYLRLPAPIFAPIVLLNLIILVITLFRLYKTRKMLNRDARLISDKAIELAAEDRLNFTPAARTVADFIRNRDTRPPLNIAITGRWGIGKSSLMGLIKEELEKDKFKPVWFNAWHYQKESSILAALYESVKQEAIPGWTTPEGLKFRVRLLFIRLSKSPPLLVALAVTFLSCVFLGIHLYNNTEDFEELTLAAQDLISVVTFSQEEEHSALKKSSIYKWVRANPGEASLHIKSFLEKKPLVLKAEASDWISERVKQEPMAAANFILEHYKTNPADSKTILAWAAYGEKTSPFSSTNLFSFLFTIIGVGIMTMLKLRSFGAKPANLISNFQKGFGGTDYKAEAGFRHRFARDFNEINQALGHRKIVFFIDDLDRCLPVHALEIMEVINFLSSSGDCFIIPGMDRDKVQEYIKSGYKTNNGEEFDAPAYMEKLINLEIATPIARHEQSRNYLLRLEQTPEIMPAPRPEPVSETEEEKAGEQETVDEAAKNDKKTSVVTFFKRLKSEHLRRFSPYINFLLPFVRRKTWFHYILSIFVFMVLLFGAIHLGFRQSDKTPSDRQILDVYAETRRPPESAKRGKTRVRPSRPESKRNQTIRTFVQNNEKLTQENQSNASETHFYVLILLFLPIFIWSATLIYFRIHETGGEIPEDRPEFIQALEDWYPLFELLSPSPRTLKRYRNRIRFLAIRNRHEWERAQEDERIDKNKKVLIPDDALVALSILDLLAQGNNALPTTSLTNEAFLNYFILRFGNTGNKAATLANSNVKEIDTQIQDKFDRIHELSKQTSRQPIKKYTLPEIQSFRDQLLEYSEGLRV